jgi:hypothetical protein
MMPTTLPQQTAWISYPAEAFPPIALEAIREVQATTQAPVELIGGVALSAMALAVQDLANVRRRANLVSGCSLFVLDIADSGERKTTVQRMFFEPFRTAQAEFEDTFQQLSEKYRTNMEMWSVEMKVLRQKLYKAIEENRYDVDIRRQIADHTRNQPTPPRPCRYIYDDITPADFLFKLHSNTPSAGIISDEVGRIFSSRLVDDLGLLNLAWDGGEVRVDRRTSESFVVKDVRVSLSWLVQEAVFKKFLDSKGDEARGIGFLSRCLISRP